MAGRFSSATKFLLGFTLFTALFSGAAPVNAAPACPALSSLRDTAGVGADQGPDYGNINRILLTQDDELRRQQLRALLHSTSKREFAEKPVLVDRLRIALAQTDIRLGNATAAMAQLKSIALDSPQAAEALVLLATAVRLQDGDDDAMRWIAHAADLFPHSPVAVEGLLLAADWQADHAVALPLLAKARKLANQHVAAVSALELRAQTPDFLSELSLANPDPLLWSLAHTALTDTAFALAHDQDSQARAFLDCLQRHLEESLALRDQNPSLLKDLGVTLDQLRTLLPAAGVALAARESEFLQTAQALRHCRQSVQPCDGLAAQRDQQGQELTQLRNSLRIMQQQQRFLAAEQQRLRQRWQKEQEKMTQIGRHLLQQSAESRAIMMTILRSALSRSKATWQDLLARTYFQLGRTQESLLAQEKENGLSLP